MTIALTPFVRFIVQLVAQQIHNKSHCCATAATSRSATNYTILTSRDVAQHM